jgi:hypothetical protein
MSRAQPPIQKALFVDADGRLTQASFQMLANLVINTQGENDGVGVIKLGPVNIHYGTGVPNGVVTGTIGDLYINFSGGLVTTLYVKTSGIDTDTGWTGK